MAAKKRNHMDAIKRNQALHTFMFQTDSTSFMLKAGPSPHAKSNGNNAFKHATIIHIHNQQRRYPQSNDISQWISDHLGTKIIRKLLIANNGILPSNAYVLSA
eukprot:812513_1